MISIYTSLKVVLASLLLTIAAAWPWDSYVTVTTQYGTVRGKVEDEVATFHSIPYAAPPSGTLRFRAPASPEPWTDVKDVYEQPNICPQIKVVGELYIGNEDCLYLHVYAPPTADPSKPLPVMFWIYGGGYRLGDGYEFGFYDGNRIAKEMNVIVVAPNYRLDALGFFAHEALAAEEGAFNSTGNYGVQDQRFALNWVKNNIAAFGGNPNNVTIFGESAGGFSVCWHLSHPLSKGLFHAAIMQSGSCSTDFFFRSRPDQVAFSSIYASHFGCNDTQPNFVECIRATPVDDILAAIAASWPSFKQLDHWPFPAGSEGSFMFKDQPIIPPLQPIMAWGPVVDGTLEGTPEEPYYAIVEGRGNYVDVIFGSNKDEGTLLILGVKEILKNTSLPLSDADMPVVLNHFFNDETVVQKALEYYPKSDYKENNEERAAVLLRDFFFLCEARRSGRAMSDHGSKVWTYQFTYPIWWVDGKVFGNYHASELYFVWGNQFPEVVHAFDSKDRQMSETFIKFWGNMAHYHNPNGAAANEGQWPEYLKATDMNIVMDVPTSVQVGLMASKCDFWDNLLPPACVSQECEHRHPPKTTPPSAVM